MEIQVHVFQLDITQIKVFQMVDTLKLPPVRYRNIMKF